MAISETRLLLEVCTIICLGVIHLVSGHEISRLQHGLQLIMARYTRIINCIDHNLQVMHASLGPPYCPQPKRHLDRFSHFCTVQAECRRACRAYPSPKNCPFPWGSAPPSNTCFLRPTRVHNSKDISNSSAVFAQLTAECSYTLQWAAHFLPQNRPLIPVRIYIPI